MKIPTFHITAPDTAIKQDILSSIDGKTKPLGALGRLEEIALKIGMIQQRTDPALKNPHIVVFAGDHGLAKEGVSAYPPEVTAQMVLNFLRQGAAINVFTEQHSIKLKIVDAGVNYDFEVENRPDNFLSEKIRKGTRNMLKEPAMTPEECAQAIERGAHLVKEIRQEGCNVIGFGEMGIGNTSSASLLSSVLLDRDIEGCTGLGTGITADQLQRKISVLKRVLEKHEVGHDDPYKVLQTFGGYEIAMMAGAFLQAAESEMVVLVDGFIASAAFLVASMNYPEMVHYAVFTHQSGERGHALILEHFNATPLLNMDMRLGEGTGCAVAYPLLVSSVDFLNKMASFEDAGVSKKSS